MQLRIFLPPSELGDSDPGHGELTSLEKQRSDFFRCRPPYLTAVNGAIQRANIGPPFGTKTVDRVSLRGLARRHPQPPGLAAIAALRGTRKIAMEQLTCP